MINVLFDTQIFDWQINGGISRYFIEVLGRLENSGEVKVQFQCNHSYNTYIQGTHWLAHSPKFRNLEFKGKLRLMKRVNQYLNRGYSNRILGNRKTTIFHPTYYDPYFLNHLGNTKMALTVYDLTNERFNDLSSATLQVLGWKKKLIAKANHIIAISENTRKDIIDYYRIAPEKVSTVYLAGGFDESLLNASESSLGEQLPDSFILFVGSRSNYKNFIPFVKDLAPVLKRYGISLVAAGGGKLTATELSLFHELSIESQVKAFSHVSDAMLIQLYRKATVFIFPSLYEGFGLPVLEAMQCRCPVLLSNNSSLPEVGGSAAAYFNPFNRGAMVATLTALLDDSAARERMVRDGEIQFRQFNWDATTAGHVRVYKKMLL